MIHDSISASVPQMDAEGYAGEGSEHEPWKVTTAKIRHLCGYITDDQAIASYLGIPRARVARVRGGMRQTYNRTFRRHRHCGDQRKAGDEPAGSTLFEEQAKVEASCKKLLAAHVELFHRTAERLGCTYGEAVAVCHMGLTLAQVRAMVAR